MEHVASPVPAAPGPHRFDWPYVVGAVLALAIRAGWAPLGVCSLAFVMLGTIAVTNVGRR